MALGAGTVADGDELMTLQVSRRAAFWPVHDFFVHALEDKNMQRSYIPLTSHAGAVACLSAAQEASCVESPSVVA